MEFLKVKGLYKSYGKKGSRPVEVLKGIDIEIGKGETVSIAGASGAGKSTFLNIIGALDRPTKGEVFYGGVSLLKMDDAGLASFRNRMVGFVFQSHNLLPEFTALENVMLPALIGGKGFKEAMDAGAEFLREVGLKERLNHKPGELSGGEQQRCAIVRALALTPEIILADEPTGNLDNKTGEEVFELLIRLNREKNITLVVVTHNERLAVRMQRRLKMADGKIIEEKGSVGKGTQEPIEAN